MRITVIVTTYNWPEALFLSLQSLRSQRDDDFEIVVADDGSNSATRDLIAEFAGNGRLPVSHVWHEDGGFRAAAIRNRAIAASSGDYIVFLDGDCFVPADFIGVHRRLAESGWLVSGRRSFVRPPVTRKILDAWPKMPPTRRATWLGRALLNQCTRPFHLLKAPAGPLRKRTPKAWTGVHSCNLAVWRRDIETVNGFDERYVGHGYEDSDLVIRLLRSGVRRKRGDAASIVFHLHHARRGGAPSNAELFAELLSSTRTMAVNGLVEALLPATPETPVRTRHAD